MRQHAADALGNLNGREQRHQDEKSGQHERADLLRQERVGPADRVVADGAPVHEEGPRERIREQRECQRIDPAPERRRDAPGCRGGAEGKQHFGDGGNGEDGPGGLQRHVDVDVLGEGGGLAPREVLIAVICADGRLVGPDEEAEVDDREDDEQAEQDVGYALPAAAGGGGRVA